MTTLTIDQLGALIAETRALLSFLTAHAIRWPGSYDACEQQASAALEILWIAQSEARRRLP